eukprot:5908427-Amphidinium_carterae.4
MAPGDVPKFARKISYAGTAQCEILRTSTSCGAKALAGAMFTNNSVDCCGSDASGEGWLGAVHHVYTCMLAPPQIVSQLDDCQIGFLEFLAVALALETWS